MDLRIIDGMRGIILYLESLLMVSVQGGPKTIYQPTSLLRIQRCFHLPRSEYSTLPHYDPDIRYAPVCPNRSRDEHRRFGVCEIFDGIGSLGILRGPTAVE